MRQRQRQSHGRSGLNLAMYAGGLPGGGRLCSLTFQSWLGCRLGGWKGAHGPGWEGKDGGQGLHWLPKEGWGPGQGRLVIIGWGQGLGGSGHPLPPGTFPSPVGLVAAGRTRGQLSSRPRLVQHTPSSRGLAGFLPSWVGGWWEENCPEPPPKQETALLLPGGQELSPWQLWDKGAALTLPRAGLAGVATGQPLLVWHWAGDLP